MAKGIKLRPNDRFEAYVSIKDKGKTKTQFIGTYASEKEAQDARKQYLASNGESYPKTKKIPHPIQGRDFDNLTGYKGIVKNKYDKFISRFVIALGKGKTFTKYLGTFETPEEAYKRRCDYLDSLK